jgi:peroxidase
MTRPRFQCIVAVLFVLLLSISTTAAPIAKQGGETFAPDGEEPVPVLVRPANGYGLNPDEPQWGSLGETLGRKTAPSHGDNVSSLAHPDMPNPRVISNLLCAEDGVTPDDRGLSDYNWLWGQFITHEIDFTTTSNGRTIEAVDSAHIAAPNWDPQFRPNNETDVDIMFFRSVSIPGTGTDEFNPRQHPNNITAWIDGSVIYGSSQARMDWLRSNEGGRMKMSGHEFGDLLPVGGEGSPGMSFGGFSANLKFIAGDVRANEHIALLALHTLFVREHNRLADAIQERNPEWTDEQVFQRARKIVAAEIAAITFEEFLPSLGITMPEYAGPDLTIEPSMFNEFATVAFRMGHSQIGNQMMRMTESRVPIPEGHLSLKEGFWETAPITDEGGIAPTLRGLAVQVQAKDDLLFVEDLRNQLFGIPGAGGMDLCAIDIQRARDHGIGDYNAYRVSYGLPAVTNWSNITSDVDIQVKLASIYDSPGHIDPLMGLLAEDHLEDSALGETLTAAITDQFGRLRSADPQWYQNDPELADVKEKIRTTGLADIILMNTEIESIQCNVFFAEHNPANFDCHLENAVVNVTGDGPADDDTEPAGIPAIGVAGAAVAGLGALAWLAAARREDE